MWDEDAEENTPTEITCDICGKPVDTEGCEHILLVVDRTFHVCEGGVASDFWLTWYEQVQEAFAAAIKGERPQTWADGLVKCVWETMLKSNYQDPESPTLPFGDFTDLIESLLWDAGGSPYFGKPISGGRCESVMLLMFAENPAEVCAVADKNLPARLQPKQPRRRRKGS